MYKTTEEFIAELNTKAAPPQPDKPLSVGEARAKKVCRICGKPESRYMITCRTMDGVNDEFDEFDEYAHSECIAREQAAAPPAATEQRKPGAPVIYREVETRHSMGCASLFDDCACNCGFEAIVERDKLQAFKDYVHKRLDEAGVPADPKPEEIHQSGCRIGSRLDWVFASLETSEAERDKAQADLRAWREAAEEANRVFMAIRGDVPNHQYGQVRDWLVQFNSLRAGSPPVAQRDERERLEESLEDEISVNNTLLAENHAMREAIGKLPKPRTADEWGKCEWDYIHQSTRDAIAACRAAAQPDSPRAKEIAERLAKAEAAAERGQQIEYAVTCKTGRVISIRDLLKSRAESPSIYPWEAAQSVRLEAALKKES